MHIPVLKKEVLDYLAPQKQENFIDGTFHKGGHSKLILEQTGPLGKVLGIELDESIFKEAQAEFKGNKRIKLVNDSYINLEKIVKENNIKNISGVLLDVGMSSWHIDESGKGFSFQKDEPLNMLYNQGITAEEIVNTYSQKDLERIFTEYGEERKARKIAENIIKNRPIKTTLALKQIIQKSVLASKITPIAKVFQALRIEANQELENLKKVLPQTLDVVEKGGRVVIISFHSLEDRIVKEFIRENKDKIEILTKKPITPTSEEIKQNSRARSAKLRAFKKI